jgi:hypothetical protein
VAALKVPAYPSLPTTVHCTLDGAHATAYATSPSSTSSGPAVTAPVAGLKVTSSPVSSTATH